MHGQLSPFNSFKFPDQITMTFVNGKSLSRRYHVKHLGIFGWGDVALLEDAGERVAAGSNPSFVALQEVSAGCSSPSWATVCSLLRRISPFS